MYITSKRYRRKPDLFSLLLLGVTLGMSVTLAYQVSLYRGGSQAPIANQASLSSRVGG